MTYLKEHINSHGHIERDDIKKIIPYEDPFLFVDKVLKISKDKITAIKQVNPNEPYLKGHFVDFPIMPGALTVEGLGQAATLLARSNIANHQEKDVLAYRLKEVKFMAPVLPPAKLRYEVELIAQDERGAIMKGNAFVKEELVAEGFLMLAIVNKEEFRSKYK